MMQISISISGRKFKYLLYIVLPRICLLLMYDACFAGLVTIRRRLLSTQMRMNKSRYAVMGPMDHCHLTTVDTVRVSCCFRLYMLKSIHLLQNEINELILHLLSTVTVVFVAGGIGKWIQDIDNIEEWLYCFM